MNHRSAAVLAAPLIVLAAAGRAPASGVEPARCEAELAARADDEEAASCFYAWGHGGPHRRQAIRRMERVLARSPELPWFTLRLAMLNEQDAGGGAEGRYRAAAAGFAARREVRGEFVARANLGRLLGILGHPDEGRLESERAIAVASFTRDPLLIARREILAAKQLFRSGREVGRAYRLLQGAERLLEEHRSAPDQHVVLGDCLTVLGNAATQLGLLDSAKRYYERHAALAAADQDLPALAAARYGVARIAVEVFAELPSPEGKAEATALATQALAAAEAGGNRAVAASVHWTLAELLGGAAARAHLEACVRDAPAGLQRSYCLGALARQLAADDPAAAQAAVKQALELARDPWSLALARKSAMRVAWALASGRAMPEVEPALAASEELRDAQERSASQAGLFSTWSDDYYWLSGRLLEASAGSDPERPERPERLERALQVTERLRARTLLDTLERAKVTPPSRERLSSRIDELDEALERTVSRSRDPGLPRLERENAARDSALLERDRAEMRQQLRQLDPAAERAGGEQFATLSRLRASLTGSEALLSYQIAPWRDWTGDFGGGAWLLVVTRAGTPRAYRLAAMGREELRRQVDRFSALFEPAEAKGRRPGTAGREALLAADLYRNLLGAALADLPPSVDQLIVVPDDALNRLPFAALRPAVDAPPLAVRYRLAEVPSATLWLFWRGHRPRPAPTPALALADPLPPDPAAQRQLGDAGILVPAGRLPYAEREARSVGRWLGGERRVGRAVSERFVKTAPLASFGILHFAAHALIDERRTENSGIWLSPGGRGEDGLLRMEEIVRLPLEGRAVVLSTCSSATGELVRGEGVLSLARAFFEARTSAVVGSLWPQWDDEAAVLFDRFYRHLAEGRTLSAALAAAQRDRIAAGAPAAAWAGVVVLGDGDLVPLPGGRSWLVLHRGALVLAAAAMAPLLLGLFLILSRRANRRAGRLRRSF